MHKPPIGQFEAFAAQFRREAAAAGKKQFLVPYFIAGHPGSDLRAMIELALYLKRHGLKPDKVQDFIPGPMDIATCMYYTGLDPMSGEPVYVPRGDRERRLQRALLQYFKPENYADVREALGRGRSARPGWRRAGMSDFLAATERKSATAAYKAATAGRAIDQGATSRGRRARRRLSSAPKNREKEERMNVRKGGQRSGGPGQRVRKNESRRGESSRGGGHGLGIGPMAGV